MLTGTCHCSALHWTLEGDPGSITVCNCTLCRRYGALWAYDYENERIRISGPSTTYTRVDSKHPSLEIHFCPTCGGVLCWRGLRVDEDGRRRIAVNVRLAPPEVVAGWRSTGSMGWTRSRIWWAMGGVLGIIGFRSGCGCWR